ncbi:hypothetical protein FB561_4573 [Kribbella amoyensis]|uniref:Peptidase inhibitor family I36 n=1 Tax=Kribbella amoyensis TaxID=996641 RepID=A0A561BX05_9ACTN|nr:hypothetical protein [Kribbella amoyensis]TWD83411.1 hypothetical protein FB561_4573 [Kribbella amoyensis]
MLKRRLAALALTLGIAVAGLVTVTQPANAATTAATATCNAGSACLYWYNTDGSATLKYQNAGNIHGLLGVGYWGGYVWNNGKKYPGADHITLTTKLYDVRWRICLHYGAVNFTQGTGVATAGKLQDEETVTGWTWRGECAAGEDRWHSY